jgi:hypothetical protein
MQLTGTDGDEWVSTLQDDRVAVTTDIGQILLVSAAQAAVKKVLPAVEDGLGHLAIQAMQHGFITITQSYELLLYEVSEGSCASCIDLRRLILTGVLMIRVDDS